MTNWTWTKAKTRVTGRPWWKILGVKTTTLLASPRRLRIFYFWRWTLAFVEGYVPSEAEEAAKATRDRIDAWWAAEEEYAGEQMDKVRADVGDGPKDYDPRRFPAG